MNSAIFNIMSRLCIAFCAIFKESLIYKLFIKIYNKISFSWQKSVIVSWLKKDNFSKSESVLYRTLRSPFSVLEFLNIKIGSKLPTAIKNSFILNALADFSNSVLALNTKVLGIFVISSTFSKNIINPRFSLISLVILIIGAFFAFINYNITDFFSESKAVNFLLNSLGFYKINWDFYEKERVNTAKAIFFSFIIGIFSGILAVKSAILAIITLIAIIGIYVLFKKPIVGVFVSAFIAPLLPTMILVGMIALTSISLIVKSLVKKDFRWKFESVGALLCTFLIFMLFSSAFSFARNKSILVWGIYLIFVGFYFIITNAVETKEQLYSILKVFVIAGAFVSLYGVLQYLFNWNTSNAWIDEEMFENATMRAYSTMENPNVLGEYLLLLIPFTAFFMLKASWKKLEKYIWILVFALSVLCMVFTQSRGCWIGLFVSLAIFITFYNGKLWGLLPLALVALPFVIPQSMIERFLSVGNLEDSSTSYRVFIWLGTISMLKDFWVGGIGMGEGAFRTVYPFYSYNSIIAPHSHNLYLQLLVEGGISALILFAVIMFVFYKKTSQVYIKNGNKNSDSVLTLAILSGVSGFLVQSMFDYTFYNYRMMSMFFMTMAFCVTLSILKGEVKNEDNRSVK